MAPRSTKGKKVADVKVAENEAPKKGRGKAKVLEDIDPEIETEDIEQAPLIEKKTKRGKKATNDANEQQNGKNDESAPPKRGRKKNVEEPIADNKSEEPLAEENMPLAGEDEENDENTDTNGHTEEPQTSGRGRKKQPKKEADKSESKSGRGRKPKQVIEQETIDTDEKPKSGKGRGRKVQAKTEEVESDKSETAEEEVKADPPMKGRKKAQKTKEKTPDSENEEEEKMVEEPKKKEVKSRKNQSKKAQAKQEAEEPEAEKEEPVLKKRKVTKKEEKGKGELKDEELADEEKEVTEMKTGKGRRGQKKPAELQAETEEEHQNADEPTTKRRRKLPEEKALTEDAKKKAPPKNKATTSYEDIDFTNTSKTAQGKDWNFKISCWNVDGIRAWMNKGGLDYIKYEKPHILCLQEIKCSKDKLPDELVNVPGYHDYWLCGDKEGYAGVGIYSKQLAINVSYGLQNKELDEEGRIITAEYEHFYLICTYVPNAGRKLVTLPKRLQWNEEFRKYVKELDKKKPVIICGDMNVSHNEIDLANPKSNRKNAGFTDEERAGMTDLLSDGFVDTFRHFNPDKTGAYTFWTYMKNSRANNVGWRLDYFLVSERLMPAISDNVIRDQVYGSDHCPITLFLHLTTADKPKD